MTGDRPETPSLDLRNLKVLSTLGRGAKGVVFLVQSDKSELLALKTISRASIERIRAKDPGNRIASEYRRICFEQQVLRSFHHPFLPKLRGVLSTDNIVGYAIDYCPGGDLNSLRNKQTERMFSDDIIRFYAAELILSLEYLHGLGIVYRDLKPENVMIQENGHLMLVDFDLSTKLSAPPSATPIRSVSIPEPVKWKKRLNPFSRCCSAGQSAEHSIYPTSVASSSTRHESDSETKSNSFVGTEEYVAPEIILGHGHDYGVDWWCLGVVLHEMLYGRTPFRGANRKETFYRILSKSPELVGEPTALRDLIGKLLEKDPKQRITVEEIKDHDFFRGVNWDLIPQIQRTPHVPVGDTHEDMDGNKVIDVEDFVQEVFKIVGDDKLESNMQKDADDEKTMESGLRA